MFATQEVTQNCAIPLKNKILVFVCHISGSYTEKLR